MILIEVKPHLQGHILTEPVNIGGEEHVDGLPQAIPCGNESL